MSPSEKPESIGINLEWFRPDPRPRLYRTYGLMVLLLLCGMGCCAAGFLGLRTGAQGSELGAAGMLVLGVVAVASAMVLMVRKAVLVLADDTCLVLRVDGLLFMRKQGDILVAWDQIDTIESCGERVLIQTDDRYMGSIVLRPRFIDVDADQLVKKMRATRQRALMGLYASRLT